MKFSFGWTFHLVVLVAIRLEWEVNCATAVESSDNVLTPPQPKPNKLTRIHPARSLREKIPHLTNSVPADEPPRKGRLTQPKNIPATVLAIDRVFNAYIWAEIKSKKKPQTKRSGKKKISMVLANDVSEYVSIIQSDVSKTDLITLNFPKPTTPKPATPKPVTSSGWGLSIFSTQGKQQSKKILNPVDIKATEYALVLENFFKSR